MMNRIVRYGWIVGFLFLLAACQTQETQPGAVNNPATPTGKSQDDLLIVDCLLPGKVQKLGRNFTYLSARQAIKTSAMNCGIRGGEYTASDRSNYATALKIWLPLAQQGDVKAQTYVGQIYEKGLGLPPDYQVAVHWYNQAAAQGYSEAQLSLGYLYEQGLGVQKDLITALNWYRKAGGINSDIALELGGKQNLQQIAELKQESQRHQARAEQLEQQLGKTQQQLNQALKQLQQRKREAESQRNRLQQLQQQLEQQRQQAVQSGNQAEVQRIEGDLTQHNQKLQQSQQEVASLREELGRLQSEAKYQQQQQSQVSQLQGKEKNLQQQLQNLQTEMAQLKQQLGQAKQAIELKQGELTSAQQGVTQARQELSRYQQLASASEQDKARLQQLQQQLQAKEQALDQKTEALTQLEGERQFYRKQLAKLETAHNAPPSLDPGLKAEVSTLKQQTQSLQTQLQQTQQQLAQEQARIAGERDSTGKIQQELAQLRQQANLSQEQQKLIESLESNLIKKRQEFDTQKQQMAKLEGEIEFYREQLAKSDQAAQKPRTDAGVKVAQAKDGPIIELIDPPLTNVRGVPVIKTRSVVKRPIVGKATAPGGILALTLNDTKLDLDTHNLFFTEVTIAANETPVNIVAIDRQGRRSALDFVFTLEDGQPILGGSIASASNHRANPKIPPLEFGKYYALVIGNNRYQHLTQLDTAINDARKMRDILQQRYGFTVTLLENATRYDVLSGLNQMREKLTEKDNFLVYYAGHGQLDTVNLRGYWLPVDAEPKSSANWIKNVDITDVLNAMTAQHILVIADSCYSGAFARSSLARLEAGMSDDARLNWIKEMLKKRSRTVFTSGGLKPVLDAGGGEHSVFAKALFQILDGNQTVLEGQQLHQQVAALVAYAAAAVRVEQIPEYSPVQHAGHEAGDFFFVPQL